MSSQLECCPTDVFGILSYFLDGHSIFKLILCGCKRLSVSLYASVRYFRMTLKQIEKFPFYVFDFASVREISVKLDEKSHDYPVRTGGRGTLALKPMISLKKLDFGFLQSSSILAHSDHFSELYPSLTDLTLTRGVDKISTTLLQALPSTLRRLYLEGRRIRTQRLQNDPISLNLLSKISQNLEFLCLKFIPIGLNKDDPVEGFQFSDSLLDLRLNNVIVAQLVSKLPRYVEHVEIKLSYESHKLKFPISVLPPTLRTFNFECSYEFAFQIDGCGFPPNLEQWNARVDWENEVLENFKFPDSLQRIEHCPLEVFGDHLERAPKSLKFMDLNLTTSDRTIEVIDIQNLPPLVTELVLCQCEGIISALPRRLTSLTLGSTKARGCLTVEVCSFLENLQTLNCHIHHFEVVHCLSAFKCIKNLTFLATNEHLDEEEKLFSQLACSSLEEVDFKLFQTFEKLWPYWITQLQTQPELRSISCLVFSKTSSEGFPEYLKRLPPHLESLQVPALHLPKDTSSADAKSIISSQAFTDCFKSLPSTLTSLLFRKSSGKSLLLSDDCFTHLPPSLTVLGLFNVEGITDRFWDVIPPSIRSVQVTVDVLGQDAPDTPSFRQKRLEYSSKFENISQ